MSAIANIGRSLGYDAVESALASGMSLADVCKLATALYEHPALATDDSAESVRPTLLAATFAPKKAA